MNRDILFYGIGNPARGDDGLGPALAAAIEALALPSVVVEADYQLTVEAAAEIAEYGVVVFADAALAGPSPCWLSRIDEAAIASAGAVGWSSHSVAPAQVVALGRRLFHSEVEAYVLAIRGYAFGDLDETLSPRAQANLSETVRFAHRLLVERTFDSRAQEFSSSAAGILPVA